MDRFTAARCSSKIGAGSIARAVRRRISSVSAPSGERVQERRRNESLGQVRVGIAYARTARSRQIGQSVEGRRRYVDVLHRVAQRGGAAPCPCDRRRRWRPRDA